MATCNRFAFRIVVGLLIVTVCHIAVARAGDELPKAMLDGNGPDWVSLGEDDFENVNCDPETWSWKDGVAHCTGTPTGVIRTKKQFKNFELVVQWRHLKPAGNSGVFVWGIPASMKDLPRGKLPHGIEVQV